MAMTEVAKSSFSASEVGVQQRDSSHRRSRSSRSVNIECLTQQRNGENLKLFSVLHAAWAVVLRAYTAGDVISFDVRSLGEAHLSSPAIVYKADLTGPTPVRRLLEQQCQSDCLQLSDSVYKTMMEVDAPGDFDAISCLDEDRAQYDVIIRICATKEQGVLLTDMEFSKAAITQEYSQALLDTFERAVSQIVAYPHATVGELDLCSDADIRRLHGWNESVGIQSLRQELVHELIQKRCSEVPESLAISAWDGEMTYSEIDRRSSALAAQLVELGVSAEDFIPVYFEKSKWVVVAALAVLKAGGAFVLIDASLPLERLRRMCHVTNARVVLCSQLQSPHAQKLSLSFVVVGDAYGETGFESHPHPGAQTPSRSSPSQNRIPDNALYAIFTSGSTGEPKGIVMTHSAFCSTTDAAERDLSFTRATRALQFASHSFTVSPREILGVLVAGGCLCIPSEKDRFDDLVGFINRHQVNLVTLTPSVASVLSPSAVPTVNTLVMGGEPTSSSLVASWASSNTRLIAVYSASELAATATAAYNITPDRDSRNLGYACGAKLWVVSQDNPDILAPVGTVGELVMESHSLARHYLGDEQRSAQTFLADAPWQRRLPGTDRYAARLYHTGDLCKYNFDGTIHLVGRKDHQVKINGQRVELGEVEHHLRAACQASNKLAAIRNLVVLPIPDSRQRTKLVALLDLGKLPEKPGSMLVAPAKECIERTRTLKAHLAASVPRYMIPADILFANNVPLTRTGKMDRVLIRELVVDLLHHRETGATSHEANETQSSSPENERILRDDWSKILGIPTKQLLGTDDFFRRGGDSIAAMQLVARLRQTGFRLTVAEVFTHPILSDMATFLRRISPSESPLSSLSASDVTPFSLLGSEEQPIRKAIEQKLGLQAAQIEDIYPCTAMQESMTTMTAKEPGLYVSMRSWTLGHEIDLEQLRDAWERVFQANPILRTRIARLPQGMFQVVVKEDINWETNGASFLSPNQMDIVRGPLICFAIDGRFFALQMHNALFDAWSLNQICGQVEQAYHGHKVLPRPFAPWVKHLMTQDHDEADIFWRAEFAGLETVHFPCSPAQLPARVLPENKLVVSYSVKTAPTRNTKTSYTAATFLRLAWAIVLWQHTGSKDVVFGATAMGRTAAWEGVRQLTGPIISAVPVRIRLSPTDQSVEQALSQTQDQLARTIAYEQTGLDRIRQAGTDASVACDFQNFLVIQPEQRQQASQSGLFSMPTPQTYENLLSYAMYPLTLSCTVMNGSIEFQACVRSSSMAKDTAQALLKQLGDVYSELVENPSTRLKDLNAVRNLGSRPGPESAVYSSIGRATAMGCAVALGVLTVRKLFRNL